MATIRFVRGEDRTFPSLSDRAKSGSRGGDTPKGWPAEDMRTRVFSHHEDTYDAPQLIEVVFPPNHKNQAHAHDADEIIVVVEGSMKFGSQVYGAGSSVFIPKMTLYSFQAGPEGVIFLNFRPTRSDGAIFKEEFMLRRQESKSA